MHTRKIIDLPQGVTNVYDVEALIMLSIDKIVNNIDPIITYQNDGIGSYEFWGARCFDHGTDYLICEGNENGEFEIEVDITDIAFDNDSVECSPQLEITKNIAYDISNDYCKTIESDKYNIKIGIYIKPVIAMIPVDNRVFLNIKLEWDEMYNREKWMK